MHLYAGARPPSEFGRVLGSALEGARFSRVLRGRLEATTAIRQAEVGVRDCTVEQFDVPRPASSPTQAAAPQRCWDGKWTGRDALRSSEAHPEARPIAPARAKDQFQLAATAQKLRKLAKLIPLRRRSSPHETERAKLCRADRCRRAPIAVPRNRISRLPQVEGKASAKRKFKPSPICYFHIDIADNSISSSRSTGPRSSLSSNCTRR